VTCTPNPVDHGSNALRTATANEGYNFASWAGDCAGASCELLSVTAPKTVTANFALKTYPITTNANPAGGGTVTCTPNPVDHGSNALCTATANEGYNFASWAGDCAGASCELLSVTAPKSVTANFTLNTYPITTNANPAGGGTVTCTPNPVEHGSDAVCTATANEGYNFVSWVGDCAGASCELLSVTAPKSVTANFALVSLGIDDIAQSEGNSGTTTFVFTVRLSAPSGVSVSVNYATADGSATNKGKDYAAASGTLTFTPGETTQTVIVNVRGDTIQELNENFYVNLSLPVGAPIEDAQGIGIIINDDLPTLKISDVSKREGRSGTTVFTFTVSLSATSTGVISVDYATANGTATAGSDYTAANGSVIFSPGEKTKAININVIGDRLQEPNETFYVNLSNPVGTTLADAQGMGTIVNDD
jgi:hypothetical protein